jgi:hypothetical protein
MEEHYLKIIEDDTECLDCEEKTDFKNETTETLSSDSSSKKEKPDVSLKINEDGVDIKVNENDN